MFRTLRLRILDRLLGWTDLQGRAADAHEQVVRTLVVAEVAVQGDGAAWGQYLERSPEIDQKGIYGTGSATEILSLDPDLLAGDEATLIEGGERWLVGEWTDPDSRTTEKRDQAILYKHAWFLSGIARAGPEPAAGDRSFSEFAEELWRKRTGWGWGEFWYPPTEDIERTAGPPRALPTAFALLSLVRSDDLRRTDEFTNSLVRLAEETERAVDRYFHESRGDKKTVTTQSALCLLALARYRRHRGQLTEDAVDSKIRSVGKRLERLVRDPKGLGTGSYEHYQFTAPLPRTRRSRYILLLTNPIVSLAFVEAGRLDASPPFVDRNWRFIDRSVETYVDHVISDNGQQRGKFRSPKTGLSYTGDHLWIAHLLHAFAEFPVDSIGLRTLAYSEFTRRLPVSIVFLLVFLLAAAIGGMFAVDAPIWTQVFTGVVLAVASAVFAQLVDRMLRPTGR